MIFSVVVTYEAVNAADAECIRVEIADLLPGLSTDWVLSPIAEVAPLVQSEETA